MFPMPSLTEADDGAVALVRHGRQLLAGDVAGSQKAPNRGDARHDDPSAKPVLRSASVTAGQALIRSRIQAVYPASFGARRAHPARTDRSRVQMAPDPFDHA